MEDTIIDTTKALIVQEKRIWNEPLQDTRRTTRDLGPRIPITNVPLSGTGKDSSKLLVR